jgi:hypothetical protein
MIQAPALDLSHRTHDPDGRATTGTASAVSWGAIFAGAAAAAALSLILLILGTGLGLSSVSPWSGAGLGAAALGASTIAWLSFTQLAASGIGGYLAGRLRTKWSGVHTDEAYFRDTAHGLLAWSVATVATAALLTSTIASVLGAGAQAGATLAGGAATAGIAAAAGVAATSATDGARGGAARRDGPDYFIDALFRRDAAATPSTPTSTPTSDASMNSSSGELVRIFANAMSAGALPGDDARYVGQLVAQRTGLPQADAEKRVNDSFALYQAKARTAETNALAAVDKARRNSSHAAMWIFVSLLVGAFIASLSATWGGRRRDLLLTN